MNRLHKSVVSRGVLCSFSEYSAIPVYLVHVLDMSEEDSLQSVLHMRSPTELPYLIRCPELTISITDHVTEGT